VALPESEENAPAESQYISPMDVEQDGPARVLLGRLGNATSRIRAPLGINYLQVQLKSGEPRPTIPDHWSLTMSTLSQTKVIEVTLKDGRKKIR